MAESTQQPPGRPTTKYALRLYLTGTSSNATLALRNVTRFCELWLRGRYELRVIDVLKEPEAAAADAIVATPTLVKHQPPPAVRIFGTLADAHELAALLGVDRATSAAPAAARSPRAKEH